MWSARLDPRLELLNKIRKMSNKLPINSVTLSCTCPMKIIIKICNYWIHYRDRVNQLVPQIREPHWPCCLEVMFLPAYVCVKDNSRGTKRIWMKVMNNLGTGIRNRWFNFGVNWKHHLEVVLRSWPIALARVGALHCLLEYILSNITEKKCNAENVKC